MKKNLLLLGTTTFLCMIVAEFLFRLLLPPAISNSDFQFSPNTKLYGWAPPPNKIEAVIDPDSGEPIYFRTNSHGWKDVEHDYDKPANIIRILFIGDSHTYGVVGLEDVYSRRVEALLKERGLENVEVISIGVRGWGTDQALEVLEREGIMYRPDIVVYQFCDNDLLDNLNPYEGLDRYSMYWLKPFRYQVLQDGLLKKTELERRITLKMRIGNSLTKSTFYYYLAKVRRDILETRRTGKWFASFPEKRIGALKHFVVADTIGLQLLYSTEESDSARAAWRLFEALLLKMNEVSHKNQADFIVFSESSDPSRKDWYLKWKIIKEVGSEDYVCLNRQWIPIDLFVPKKRLSELCQRNGIEYIPSRRPYIRYELDRHANKQGNENMALDIVDYLMGSIYLKVHETRME